VLVLSPAAPLHPLEESGPRAIEDACAARPAFGRHQSAVSCTQRKSTPKRAKTVTFWADMEIHLKEDGKSGARRRQPNLRCEDARPAMQHVAYLCYYWL
jgi:hypothetical protein